MNAFISNDRIKNLVDAWLGDVNKRQRRQGGNSAFYRLLGQIKLKKVVGLSLAQ